MAQTVTKVIAQEDYAGADVGGVKTSIGTCLGPASYATGGFGLTTAFITGTIYDVKADAPGYVCAWDGTNALLEVFRNKDPGDAGGADIAFPEVGAAVDLSAATVRVNITHV